MSNANSYSRNNGKKPVQPVFSTKVTIVLEMVDENFEEISSDVLEENSDKIIDSVLEMLGLGNSYIYPDMDVCVTDNNISFEIDLNDEEYSGEKITPKSYSQRVDSLKREMDEFNDDVEYNNMPRMCIYIEDDSGKKTKYISCCVKAICFL